MDTCHHCGAPTENHYCDECHAQYLASRAEEDAIERARAIEDDREEERGLDLWRGIA